MPKPARTLLLKRKRTPDIHLVLGSGNPRRRKGSYVIGRPQTNYLILPLSRWPAPFDFDVPQVDAVADRLSALGLTRRELCRALRQAVLSAHEAGSQKFWHELNQDRRASLDKASRALHPLSDLVAQPGFIPSIRNAALFYKPGSVHADATLKLADALDRIAIVEDGVAMARRTEEPKSPTYSGKPYIAGLADSLVGSWHSLTGVFPSKTRKSPGRSKSLRVLFWEYADLALIDLSIEDEPIDYYVRSAIERRAKG